MQLAKIWGKRVPTYLMMITLFFSLSRLLAAVKTQSGNGSLFLYFYVE